MNTPDDLPYLDDTGGPHPPERRRRRLDATTVRRSPSADREPFDWSAGWIDDEGPSDQRDGRAPRRRGLLLVTAAVPWLIVVLLLVMPGRSDDVVPSDPSAATDPGPSSDGDDDGGEDDAADEGLAGDGPASDPPLDTPQVVPPDDVATADGASGHEPDDITDLDLLELRGAWRVEPGDEVAAVIGVAVARSWLTTMEPQLETIGLEMPATARYAEHLTIEAVERPSADTAVVTLLAIVLEGEDALEASVRRLAVPIVWHDDGPRPSGPPWPLPAPRFHVDPLPAGQELDDPDLLLTAIAALEAAGFTAIDLSGLEDTGLGPVLAHVEATSPDGEPFGGEVWLRRHLDGFVVAGTSLAEP